MSEIILNQIPPPPCPLCGAPTTLKNRHKNTKPDGYTCVFKCTACAVEYPMHVTVPAPGQPRSQV